MTAHSHAEVQTDRADRWVKQLGSHLGRRAEVRDADGGQLLLLAGGSCLMTADERTLRFAASAPDDEALGRIEHVVGGHLERFAVKDGLTVAWQRG